MDLMAHLDLFSAADAVAVALLFLGWGLIGHLIDHASPRRPSVTVLMMEYRREWMRQFVTRQPRIFDATVIRACLEACLMHAKTGPFGAVFPDELYTNAGKYTGAANYSLMVRHLHDIAGGAVVTAPSISDLENAEVGALAKKYMTANADKGEGEYRTRLFHAIRDLTADSYGGWKNVTNIQAGGGLYAQRIVTRRHYDIERARQMALVAARMVPADH